MYLSHGVHPKKISVPALILTLFLAALAGSLLIDLTKANPIGLPSGFETSAVPVVEVIELDMDKLTLTVLVRNRASFIEVFVDGRIWSRRGWVAEPIMVSLEGLSNGWHTLEVVATVDSGGVNDNQLGGGPRFISEGSSGVTEFLVDNPPPMVSSLSLTNVAAGEADFQFALRVVGKSLSWVGYSVDGRENVTVNSEALAQSSLTSQIEAWLGNVTLAGLSGGSHSVVVYAEETTGSTGASSPLTFTVETAGQQIGSESLPFPATLPIVAVLVVAVVSFGLVAYFLRRKKRRSTA
jgi:hypothetical protein